MNMEVERADKSPESSKCSPGASPKISDGVENDLDALDVDAYAYGLG
jgi:hypothetical protein